MFYAMFWLFEFSLKYTKLATLAIKAYAGKSKINLAKIMLLPVKFESGHGLPGHVQRC